MKLITTKAGNKICVAVMVAVGLILTVIVENDRSATSIFLATTVVESWAFTLVYGLWSKWRSADVARALFYLGSSYALLSTHILISAVFGLTAFSYNSDVRQLLYLALAASMLNILLVVRRMQWETLEEVKKVIRDAYSGEQGGSAIYRLGHEDGVAESERQKDQ